MLLSFFKICLSVCCSDWTVSIILSSRSFIHSALFSLIAIAFSLVFISALGLSNFDWFLYIISSSLLQWSEFLFLFLEFNVFYIYVNLQHHLYSYFFFSLLNQLKFYLLFFSFIFIGWRLITLQYCSGFCHTLTWISHGFTCIPLIWISINLSLYIPSYWFCFFGEPWLLH